MTIEQVLSIIEIADTGSFSNAARNLHTSQPNLSYIVKTVEDQMGEKMFLRTSDGMILTERGEEIVNHLRFLKNDYLIVDALINNKTSYLSRMSFNVITLNLFSVRNPFIKLIEKYKNIPIDFSLNDYMNIKSIYSHINEVDYAIIGIIVSYLSQVKNDCNNLGIEYHPIEKLQCYAIVGKKNKFFEKKDLITIEELQQSTLVQYREDPDNPQQSVIHALGLSNTSFGKVMVNHADAYFELIRSTESIGIDFFSYEKFLLVNKYDDMKLIKIENCQLEWEVAWIKKRQYPLSDIGAEFLEQVKKLF